MKKLYPLIVLYLTITTFSASSEISGLQVGQLSVANADSLFTSDSLALVALYDLHSGPGWPDDSNWLEGSLETWYGVTVADNRVTALNLADVLHLPYGEDNTLPAQFGNLSALKILNLSHVGLTGLSDVIGRLTSLEELYLRDNDLEGALPDTLWSLKNLRVLDVAGNRISGGLSGKMGRLTNLEVLLLRDNDLTGPVPPEIENLNQLEVLDLAGNELSGTILDYLTSMNNLVHLLLEENSFSGTVPAEFASLTKLQVLKLFNNQFSGPILNHLASAGSLTHLVLRSNNFSGTVPSEFANLKRLEVLDLSYNEFSGSVLPFIVTADSLTHLGLTGNSFSETVPPEIANLKSLKVLNLSNNDFSGPVLDYLNSMDSLTELQLEQNNFEGTIPPDIGNLKKLESLNLNSNDFSGELPSELGNLTNLNYLLLANNNFQGAVPQSIAGLRLFTVDISFNDFYGLPVMFNGDLRIYFNIEGNRFTFEDIETNLGRVPEKADYELYYKEQQKVGQVETKYAKPGEPYTLSVYVGGRNNQYQWFKDGAAVSEKSVSPEIVVENVVEGDNGDFFCRITSSRVEDMTLESNQISLVGTDGLIANAGNDFAVAVDSVVTLNATGSYNPANQLLTYRWVPPEGIELTGSNSAEPQFIAPEVDMDTPFTFILFAGDGNAEVEDEVEVNVIAPRIKPVAIAGNDSYGYSGEEFELNGYYSYSTYNEHTFSWIAPPGIELLYPNGEYAYFWIPEVETDTDLMFILTVNDGFMESDPDTVWIHVEGYLTIPVADAGDSVTVDAGETVSLDGSGSTDPQGDNLSFVWLAPEGITLNDPDQPQSSFVAPEFNADTTLTFYLVVTNSKELSDTARVDITIHSVAVGVPIVASGKIQVYPNPSNGHITLLLNEVEATMNYRLIVTSASGVRILEMQLTHTGTTNLDLSSQNPGVYFIQLIDKNHKYVERIMIK